MDENLKIYRFRRLRGSPVLRNLLRETRLSKNNFIQPFFVREGKNRKEPVESMPGISRFSLDFLQREIEDYICLGGQAALLFGVPNQKDPRGKKAYSSQGIIQKTLKTLKKNFPDFFLITDICLCGYTDHGHCGIIKEGEVDNDETLSLLGKIAVSHAEAGADMVAPSDMMDFRVRQIRQELDLSGFKHIPILSYAVKYASAFYGPFREAVQSAPAFGDRKTYQMDYANAREALKEARQDVAEGADLIMVKPALAYLDVISLLRKDLTVPIVAYSVSGEYSLIKAASKKDWIAEKEIVLEIMTAIKRAGADLILTYYAKDLLKWLG